MKAAVTQAGCGWQAAEYWSDQIPVRTYGDILADGVITIAGGFAGNVSDLTESKGTATTLSGVSGDGYVGGVGRVRAEDCDWLLCMLVPGFWTVISNSPTGAVAGKARGIISDYYFCGLTDIGSCGMA